MWNFVVLTAPLTLFLLWFGMMHWLIPLQGRRYGQALRGMKREDLITLFGAKRKDSTAQWIGNMARRVLPGHWIIWVTLIPPSMVWFHIISLAVMVKIAACILAAYMILMMTTLVGLHLWKRWSSIVVPMTRFHELRAYVLFEKKLLMLQCFILVIYLGAMVPWARKVISMAALLPELGTR